MKTTDFTSRILPLKDNLYRVSYRITHDAAQARQIVQEVMLKVWDQRNDLEMIDNLAGYCMVVTRNLSLKRKTKPASCTNLETVLIFYS